MDHHKIGTKKDFYDIQFRRQYSYIRMLENEERMLASRQRFSMSRRCKWKVFCA